MPQRRDANRNPKLAQTALLQFPQRQIRLGFDPALQPPIMGGQTRTAITPNRLGQALAGSAILLPKSFDTLAADTKPLAHLTGPFAAFPCGNNPLS